MQLPLQVKTVLKSLKVMILLSGVLGGITSHSIAQTTFNFNALIDAELSKAGKNSHYYYNEIDQNNIDTRFGVAQVNLITQLKFNPQWSFNTRILLEREKGQKLEKFTVPQLNIQWLSSKRKFGLTLGTFTNPFGAFNQKQLSTERNLIGLPLAYAYYHNVSDKIGFMEGMGDIDKVAIDGEVQWGTTNLYYGGYTTGVQFSWNIKPSTINWQLALVSGAVNLQNRITEPLHFGIISRLKIQPTYFWEQGISFSHGTFMQESDVSGQLDNLRDYTQSVVGVDFKLGSGFLELSGEMIGAFYRVPQFNSETGMFNGSGKTDALDLSNFSAYLDIKYEPPIIQGSYIAYRIDHLRFSKLDTEESPKWDNQVLRHSIAIGYHINQYLLARIGLSTQQVDNKSWDKTQRTVRLMVTAHY